MKRYPNLPLIEERFKNLISDRIGDANPNFDVEVFSQTFLGRDGLKGKNSYRTSDCLTSHYVSVIYEENTEIYGIFQGNDPVYIVFEANELFYEDLSNHELVPVDVAKSRYEREENSVFPTAHWYINCDGYYIQCSRCKQEPPSGHMTAFCPNCGAKMDLNYKSI